MMKKKVQEQVQKGVIKSRNVEMESRLVWSLRASRRRTLRERLGMFDVRDFHESHGSDLHVRIIFMINQIYKLGEDRKRKRLGRATDDDGGVGSPIR